MQVCATKLGCWFFVSFKETAHFLGAVGRNDNLSVQFLYLRKKWRVGRIKEGMG